MRQKRVGTRLRNVNRKETSARRRSTRILDKTSMRAARQKRKSRVQQATRQRPMNLTKIEKQIIDYSSKKADYPLET